MCCASELPNPSPPHHRYNLPKTRQQSAAFSSEYPLWFFKKCISNITNINIYISFFKRRKVILFDCVSTYLSTGVCNSTREKTRHYLPRIRSSLATECGVISDGLWRTLRLVSIEKRHTLKIKPFLFYRSVLSYEHASSYLLKLQV